MQFLPGLVKRLLKQRCITNGLQQVLHGPARLLHRVGKTLIGSQAVSQMGHGEETVWREHPESVLQSQAGQAGAARWRRTGASVPLKEAVRREQIRHDVRPSEFLE